MQEKNYWLLGANWEGEELKETFFRRGYWEMGYEDIDKPQFADKRDRIKENDRVAIKRMNGKGSTTITILAIGIVKEVAEKRVFISWILTDMERIVESKGVFATIHGPYSFNDKWTNEVFCI